MKHITFTVTGRPQTKGSTKTVRGRIVNDNPKCKQWEHAISLIGHNARVHEGLTVFQGPVAVVVHFYLRRPLRGKQQRPIHVPDLDKLVRAVLDGLTGVIVMDDSQVVALHSFKSYAVGTECAVINITALAPEDMLTSYPIEHDLLFMTPKSQVPS